MYQRIIDKNWDFRTANTKEYTHCYHSYPAMMIPQVARKLIHEYAPKGKLELLFDPYMGSGTSLVEASLSNIKSIGSDLNPLARLISKVKTTHYDLKTISHLAAEIQFQLGFYAPSKVYNKNFDRISNYTYWYSNDSLLRLTYINQLIEEIALPEYRDFFYLCLSETVREASFTRNSEFKRYRMAKEKIATFKPEVFSLFETKLSRNISGLKEFNMAATAATSTICNFNTTKEIPNNIIRDESVDMIVTSPPYGDSRTTVAYGQFSRWANEWFNFENAKDLDCLLMGGKRTKHHGFYSFSINEELNSIKLKDEKRYYEVISFLNDYYLSIKNVAPKVRCGGRICYVVGNRRVKDTQIDLDYFTAEIFEKFGFKHEITIIREIPSKRMPSKNSPTNKPGDKATTMINEYIVIMTKESSLSIEV